MHPNHTSLTYARSRTHGRHRIDATARAVLVPWSAVAAAGEYQIGVVQARSWTVGDTRVGGATPSFFAS